MIRQHFSGYFGAFAFSQIPKRAEECESWKKVDWTFQTDRRAKCSLVQVSGEGWVQVFVYRERFTHTRFEHHIMAIGQEKE